MVAVAEEEDLPHDLMDARVGKRPLFPRDTMGWLLVWFSGGFCILGNTHNYSIVVVNPKLNIGSFIPATKECRTIEYIEDPVK
jgi:hypothetical protein